MNVKTAQKTAGELKRALKLAGARGSIRLKISAHEFDELRAEIFPNGRGLVARVVIADVEFVAE